MLTESLFIKNQNIDKNHGFNLTQLHSNIESIACNNEETIIIIDHCLMTYSVYNYNKKLYSILGNKFNALNAETILKDNTSLISKKVEKYIKITNKYFTSKIYENKHFYTSIHFEYGSFGSDTGLCIKLVPLLYTFDKKLYSTLCIIKPQKHIGKINLNLHDIKNKKDYRYDELTEKFVDIKEFLLSDEEKSILTLSCEGKIEREIGIILNTPLSKIKASKANIFEKLKVKSISEAIYIALKNEIIR